jgi:hypothetical protein
VNGDDTVIVACGGAEIGDMQFLATFHCVDDGIIAWLARRERRRRVDNAAPLDVALPGNPLKRPKSCHIRGTSLAEKSRHSHND